MKKERIVYDTLNGDLTEYPQFGLFDSRLKLRTYHISKTPFVVVYDYVDIEVCVFFIVPQRADRSRLSVADV